MAVLVPIFRSGSFGLKILICSSGSFGSTVIFISGSFGPKILIFSNRSFGFTFLFLTFSNGSFGSNVQ